MTRQDFILSVVSSIIASLVYKLGYKGTVYLRSKPFRKKRKRFMRNVIARSELWINDTLISPFLSPIKLPRPVAIAFAIVSLTSFIVVYQLARNTHQDRLIADRVQVRPVSETVASTPSQRVRVLTSVVAQPCPMISFIDESKKSPKRMRGSRRGTASIDCYRRSKKVIGGEEPLVAVAMTS